MMPTGYTADVQSGKITDFSDFAMTCARAFGAMISMRDDPMDKPYQPEKVGSYHPDQIKAKKTELARLIKLSDDQIMQEWKDEHAERVRNAVKYRDEKTLHASRYRAMLAEVESWTPPTSEHVGLKDFMIEQIKGSLDSDCRPGTYDDTKLPDPHEWHTQRVQRVRNNVAYHEDEYRKEVERVAKRNKWVEDLRNSLTN